MGPRPPNLRYSRPQKQDEVMRHEMCPLGKIKPSKLAKSFGAIKENGLAACCSQRGFMLMSPHDAVYRETSEPGSPRPSGSLPDTNQLSGGRRPLTGAAGLGRHCCSRNVSQGPVRPGGSNGPLDRRLRPWGPPSPPWAQFRLLIRGHQVIGGERGPFPFPMCSVRGPCQPFAERTLRCSPARGAEAIISSPLGSGGRRGRWASRGPSP
ncbi:hypothetical protein MJT46_008833 [Ovis ammon polii x Ovis aries]|nr:hypothetical protein MJT46_008833 [Ovis ammon polii x Ovis aries]